LGQSLEIWIDAAGPGTAIASLSAKHFADHAIVIVPRDDPDRVCLANQIFCHGTVIVCHESAKVCHGTGIVGPESGTFFRGKFSVYPAIVIVCPEIDYHLSLSN
jgi:hypothetical protein